MVNFLARTKRTKKTSAIRAQFERAIERVPNSASHLFFLSDDSYPQRFTPFRTIAVFIGNPRCCARHYSLSTPLPFSMLFLSGLFNLRTTPSLFSANNVHYFSSSILALVPMPRKRSSKIRRGTRAAELVVAT